VTSKWTCSDLGLHKALPPTAYAVEPQTQRAAQPTAYKCTGFDGGTTYSAKPCPKFRSTAVPVIGGSAGTMAFVTGPVHQEVVDRASACEAVRSKRERAPARISARGIGMMEQRISDLCY
jgi:hypothetical protein